MGQNIVGKFYFILDFGKRCVSDITVDVRLGGQKHTAAVTLLSPVLMGCLWTWVPLVLQRCRTDAHFGSLSRTVSVLLGLVSIT